MIINEEIISDINITPFTDVILVLLIIFMVSAPFVNTSLIQVELPEIQKNLSGNLENISLNTILTINNSGEIFLNNEGIKIIALREKLEGYSGDETIIINCDASSPCQILISVLDELKKSNLYRIKMSVIERELN